MVENSPNLEEETDIQIQEAHIVPDKRNYKFWMQQKQC